MQRLLTIILLSFVLSGVSLAQSDGTLETVRSVSQDFRGKVDAGSASVKWTGLGLVSGDMVDMDLTNNSDTAQDFRFVPGMILQDPGKRVQPIILEENLSFSLGAGESVKRRMRGYCLDYSKEPPASGTEEDYQVVPDLGGYDQAVQVLYQGLRLDQEQKLKPVLRPLVHRTVVIQRAIWAVLGGDNPDSEDDLKEDLEDEIRYRSSIFPEGQLNCLSDRIWSDVQKVMAGE